MHLLVIPRLPLLRADQMLKISERNQICDEEEREKEEEKEEGVALQPSCHYALRSDANPCGGSFVRLRRREGGKD